MKLRGDGEMRLIVFSAIGSLPLHIAAVLVFAGGPERLPPEATGLISSVILGGLFAACVTQALGFLRPLFSVRLSPLVVLQIATLLLLPQLDFGPALLAWFLVGWISGVFMYKGMVAAALAQDKYVGYLARVVVAMVLAGLIALGVSLFKELSVYTTTCVIYAIMIATVYLITRPADKHIGPDMATAPPAWRTVWLSVRLLPPLVLFFVGSLMVGSHISVLVRIEDVSASPVGVFAVAKILAALLIAATMLVWRRDSVARLLASIFLLMLSVGLLAAETALPILISVIGFEFALNIAGAAYMAEVAREGPTEIGRFIPTAGLLGVALGPAVGAYLAAVMTPQHMLLVALAAIAASLMLHFLVVRRDFGPMVQRAVSALPPISR